MAKKIEIGSGSAIVILLFYLFFWPVPIHPSAWIPPSMPSLTGIYQENDQLASVERLEGVAINGPEDLAIDTEGFLYAGMADGTILRFPPDRSNPTLLADTGGRPLGLALDAHDSLIVADAFQGLLAIAPDGRLQRLTAEVNGEPINFADGLAIAADGRIFFTVASTRFKQNAFMLDLYEHQSNGRLLVYDPSTGKTSVVLDKLYFANGVAMSPDQTFLLVSEMGQYRVLQYWLQGARTGQVDVFIENLPGFPDNIHSNGKDVFWVGLSSGPKAREMLDSVLPYPFLRKLLVRLPQALIPAPPRGGAILGIDLDGKVRFFLQDQQGIRYSEITTAMEHSGMLYLGSPSEDAIGRLPIPK